jgi:hypothetical protein
MWVKIGFSVLLVVVAVALPGLSVVTGAPAALANPFLPAKVLAAPAAVQPAVSPSLSARPQDAPAPMMGMMGTSMPMTSTMSMQMEDMGRMMQMMGMMMQMMGQMQYMAGSDMGMMGGMHAAVPMTGTMGMSSSMPMTSTQSVHMQSMGMMMQMMAMMLQMMGHGQGMMGATVPMTSTMPMTGTMGMMAGEMGMMDPMAAMMEMMQGMMGGMMGGMMSGETMGATAPALPVTVTATLSDSASAPAASAPVTATLLPQTFQAGAVAVTVQPLNLGAQAKDTLDFAVRLETHTGSLDDDLSKLAMLRVGEVEVPASAWEAPRGGHHIDGILSFPAVDAGGNPLLAGATEAVLIFRGLAGAGEQELTWAVASPE